MFKKSLQSANCLRLRRDIEGLNLSETARKRGLGYWALGQAKLKLAEDLREFMGASAIDDSLRVPAWRSNLMVDREPAACLADRRSG